MAPSRSRKSFPHRLLQVRLDTASSSPLRTPTRRHRGGQSLTACNTHTIMDIEHGPHHHGPGHGHGRGRGRGMRGGRGRRGRGGNELHQSNQNSPRLNGRSLVGLEAKFRPMGSITLCNHILPTKGPMKGVLGPPALQACRDCEGEFPATPLAVQGPYDPFTAGHPDSSSAAQTSGGKKTRTKPIRNAEGVLIRKDGRPDMRSVSSANNLRKVHAKKEAERAENEGRTPTSARELAQHIPIPCRRTTMHRALPLLPVTLAMEMARSENSRGT